MVSTAPDKGRNYFYLGQVYLALEKQDSAKIYFEKGKGVKDAGYINYIGLAHVDLIYGNKTSAQNNIAMAMQNAKRKTLRSKFLLHVLI